LAVCEDPDDDKFIACTIAGKCDIVDEVKVARGR